MYDPRGGDGKAAVQAFFGLGKVPLTRASRLPETHLPMSCIPLLYACSVL